MKPIVPIKTMRQHEQRGFWDHLQKTPALVDAQIARRRAQRAFTKRHWEDIRATRMVKRYGLSFDQHAAMLDKQGELCAICKQCKPLVVDHDHQTNRFRGLLCHKCNLNLGKLEAPWMRDFGARAISYSKGA